MTLIAALRVADGVILGSDSQQTRGRRGRRLARPARKVYEPRPGLLLAAAGAQDVAQEFSLRLQQTRGLTRNVDRLQVKSCLQGLLRQLRDDPAIEERSDHVEFLLAWWPREGVQMATIMRHGVQVIEAEELRELHDAVDVWERRCAELLRGGRTPASASGTADRGVGPPSA